MPAPNGIFVAFQWCVQNDQLIIGHRSTGRAHQLLNQVAEQLMTWTGYAFLNAERRYTILECGPDTIQLAEGSHVLFFHRLPK